MPRIYHNDKFERVYEFTIIVNSKVEPHAVKTILAYVQFFAFIGCGVAIKHAIFKRKTGQYLPDSVITTKYAESERVCSMHCTSIDACLSVNYKASGVDQGVCQLNNSTTSESLHLVSNDKFVHLSILKRVRYFLIISLTNYICHILEYVLLYKL